MDVQADRDRCLGAGMCVLTAPGVFDQDEDEGLVLLLDPRPPQDRHAAVRIAAGVCPAEAVTISEPGSSTTVRTATSAPGRRGDGIFTEPFSP
ncbi:ferredoxin [Streptomyces bikiniensis]|uniref:ferredoxin n=1 Tax=Streptomyces bikiniensis TaxID=1896 RepID=UPI000995E912|nr:ferredoxin [Streptomyces bikiniensis]